MLEIKKLSSGYEGKKVLRNVALTIPEKKLISVIGPNGAGKSTFLKTLAGIVPKTEGEILIDGKEISAFSGKELAREISYLVQGRNIPDMTVKQLVLHGRFPYLDYPRRYKEADREMAYSVMDRMKITPLAERMLRTLSGGERQKAYLAMALTQDTKYILLDEPTTYLDIKGQISLMKMLKGISAEKTVVSVSHDLLLAFNFSDYIVIINDGGADFFDTPENLASKEILHNIFGIRLKNVDGVFQYDIF